MKNNFRSILVVSCMLIFSCLNAHSADELCNTDVKFQVNFKSTTVFLTKQNKTQLDSLFKILLEHPICKISVEGHSNYTEKSQQVSWDRVKTVIDYLIDKGLSPDRIVFKYGLSGDVTTKVNISTTNEDGPSYVPAPIPCLSYHKLTPKRCPDPH